MVLLSENYLVIVFIVVFLNYFSMIIQHTSIKYHSRNHNISSIKQLKQSKGFEGKRIINQVAFSSVTHRQAKNKIQTPQHHDKLESDTFRELFSKRDRHKDLQSKMENKFFKKVAEDSKSDKNINPSRSQSKSKSKSKGIAKSRSMKQLGKKSKSMVRLEVKETKERKQHHYSKVTRQQRKSESPNRQLKSTISFVEKKNYKSNSISKTNREYISEITTDRQRSKGKLKASQTLKPSKKTKHPEQPKKKNTPKPINCKKKQQNIKLPKNAKISTSNMQAKKDKKIIVSQQNSKVKRNQCEQWESIANQDQFLHPKQKRYRKEKKAKQKDVNMVQIPKRKQRLSLNSTNKRQAHDKNTKTQAEVYQQRQRIKDIENLAAVTIQKVVRGYLTRKYIRECFQYNAALNIQRVWRGYRVRRYLPKMLAVIRGTAHHLNQPLQQQNRLSQKQQQEYLLQRSSPRQDQLRNCHLYNQKWASILEEILSQQSVNSNIKKKIEVFLERQRKEMSEFDYRSNRSSKSSISNQIINNQINSEKHFMENFIQQERKKKQSPNMAAIISPTNYKSPKRFGYNSPQSYLINSPNYFIQEKLDESHELNSSQMLIQNLKNIQRFHRQRLQSKAVIDKEQLNNMLMKNKLSPRTHQKKYKQVQEILVNQLSKFNESINQIVTCIRNKESPDDFDYGRLKSKRPFQEFTDFNSEEMITPKKELVPLQVPFQMPEECINSQKLYQGEANPKTLDQKSQQFCEYYKFHKEQLKKQQSMQAFDSSYPFIEEYLINLIDFVRQYDKGTYITRILNLLKSPRNHQPQSILSNMKLVTESSNQDLDNSFKLPMYKYIDLDEQIIEYRLIGEFNDYFLKLKKTDLAARNQLQEYFLKMVADCMNEALNSLRPSVYLFTDTQLRTINTLKSMDKIPVFQSDNNSEQEMQYQYMLAQTLNKIFYWNKLEWGKVVNLKMEEDDLQYEEMKQLLVKQDQYCFRQLVAKEEWNFCDQLVEMIGLLTQEIFSGIIFEEIGSIWTVFMASRTNPRHTVTLKMLDFPYFAEND